MRFGEVEMRFGEVGTRFGELEFNFGEVETHFGELEMGFGEVAPPFGEVEMCSGEVGPRFGEVETCFGEVLPRSGEVAPPRGRVERRRGEVCARFMLKLLSMNLVHIDACQTVPGIKSGRLANKPPAMPSYYYGTGIHYGSFATYAGASGPTTGTKKMIEIAYNLTNLDDRQILQKIEAANDTVAGKPLIFVTPNPSILTVSGSHDAAEAILDQIDALEVQLVTLRTNRESAMATSIANHHVQGAYVLTTANGNPAIVTTGGFTVALPPTPTPAVPLGQVQGNMVTPGINDGTGQAKWEKLAGSKSFELETAASSSGPYAHHSTVTSNTVALTGQTSGVKIWTRVRGINKLGPGPWSDPACCTIP